jgi:hypothetical protein
VDGELEAGTHRRRLARLAAPRQRVAALPYFGHAIDVWCGLEPRTAARIMPNAMTKYRFVTPHRIGKWYPSIEQAQRFADRIGAGFFERLTRRFVAYKDTRLEHAEFAD